jgi:putative DNA methylase
MGGAGDLQHPQTLLDVGLPLQRLTSLAKSATRRDPVYGAHRWWARRPGPTCRAVLLAAVSPADTQFDDFWASFEGNGQPLAGIVVGDPFLGGATSLVEAQRLGADVVGLDIDPLAVIIAEHELEGADEQEFERRGRDLIAYLEAAAGRFYPRGSDGAEPLHYFYLRRVTCPLCKAEGLLYKSLVIARDTGRAGAVVRDNAITAFCPECLRLHGLPSEGTSVNCCGVRQDLDSATFTRGRYLCKHCQQRSSHAQLRTALAPEVCIAVEETLAGARRRFRSPTAADVEATRAARNELAASELPLPRKTLPANSEDGRPQLYGIRSVADMFGPRQLLVLGHAFHWLGTMKLPDPLRRALALAISNALASNNLFCGYATEYGRLAPLFSVRSYSLPALAVELNPLHPSAGRGTLSAVLRRVARSISPSGGADAPLTSTARSRVSVGDARSLSWPDGTLDLVLTDPPYFNYIPYSDLSRFYRAWLETAGLLAHQTGTPLHPRTRNDAPDFAAGLGKAFGLALRALKPGGPLIFSYHSTDSTAWRAVGAALVSAGFDVTTAFPVWADIKSVGHNKDGNCEWDVYLVCRQRGAPVQTIDVDLWMAAVKPHDVGLADHRSWALAAETIDQVRQGRVSLDTGRTTRRHTRTQGTGRADGAAMGKGTLPGLRGTPSPDGPSGPERVQPPFRGRTHVLGTATRSPA